MAPSLKFTPFIVNKIHASVGEGAKLERLSHKIIAIFRTLYPIEILFGSLARLSPYWTSAMSGTSSQDSY